VPPPPLTPHFHRAHFDFDLPALPCLIAWTQAGPGSALGGTALTSCASEAAAELLVRKFIRDTWDEPAGAGGVWAEAHHGAWVDDGWVEEGLGM
jgi:hypothetical protein